MTQMLASVTSTHEASMALQAQVDIIDLKNPLEGALGALPLSTISEIIAVIQQRAITSATIGDLPMQPALLLDAVEKTVATGVDIVKIGFFAGEGQQACITALKPLSVGGVRLVAVLFADDDPDFELLPQLGDAGFYGVMLDTALKNGLGLVECISSERLQQFVGLARKHGLKAGLAGSLRQEQLAELILINPDYLGFRGALCVNHEREQVLDQARIAEFKRRLQGESVVN